MAPLLMPTLAPILHVNAETTWRGGENQVFLLARGMHPVRPCIVACRANSPLERRLTAAGIPVYLIPGDRGLRSILALRRAFKDLKPALIHAHTSRAHQACMLARWGLGIPICVTRRVDFPLKRGFIARWKYGPGVRTFVAISAAIATILRTGGVRENALRVIPSGIDFAALDALPAGNPWPDIHLPSNAEVVLNVAALVDHKDHATLLRAWVAIEAQHPRAHLVIAGEGELHAELAKLMTDLGLQRVHLLGYRSDVISLMKSSQLFVMSSHLEGLCTSIMDAKRCGLPVVATAAGGIPEVVRHTIDGILVPIRTPEALAQALHELLADPQRRQLFAAAARADSERFSAEMMTAAYVQCYGEIVSNPPSTEYIDRGFTSA